MHNVGCNEPSGVTHISLIDKESESSPRMTEIESLDSGRRVVPKVFKRWQDRALWRSLTFRHGGAVSGEGLSRLLLWPHFFRGVGRTLSAFSLMVNQEGFFSYSPTLLLIFCFMFHPNIVIIPYIKDAHRLVTGYILVTASHID